MGKRIALVMGTVGAILILIGFQGEPTTLVDWVLMIVGLLLLVISYLRVSPTL